MAWKIDTLAIWCVWCTSVALLLLTGCASVRPCLGTAKGVYETCGCHPRDDSFLTRVDALEAKEVVKQVARKCATGDVAAGEHIRGATKICI